MQSILGGAEKPCGALKDALDNIFCSTLAKETSLIGGGKACGDL